MKHGMNSSKLLNPSMDSRQSYCSIILGRIENIVQKRENAGQKAIFSGSLKVGFELNYFKIILCCIDLKVEGL